MDPRERMNDYRDTLREVAQSILPTLWTALPGIIISFDPDAMTAQVQPGIKAVVMQPSGPAQSVALPVLPDVPVVFPGGGGCTLTFPVQAGDECLVVFAARCIDGWWSLGGVQPPLDARRHDLSDGFALVGVRSKPRAFPVPLTGAQLRTDDGGTLVEVSPGTVRVVAPTKVHLDTPLLEVTGDVKAGTVSLQNHVHAGVQSGSSNTAAPVP